MARLAFDDVRTNCAEKTGVLRRAYEKTKDAFQRFGKKTTAILVDGVFLTVFGIGIAACGDTNKYYNTCPTCPETKQEDVLNKDAKGDAKPPIEQNDVYTNVPPPEINNGDNTGHDRQVFYDVSGPEITPDVQYVDVLPEATMDVVADVTDTQSDITQPPPQFFSYTFTSLIGDFLDRTLEDRGTLPSEYPTGTDDLADTANPFTDGNGGFLTGEPGGWEVPDETALYRISGAEFEPLATVDVVDDFQALWYKETQNIWVSGSVYYSQAEDDMLAEFGTVAYTIKFDGPGSKNFGIPVCAKILSGTNYTACEDDYKTTSHKVKIKFLGEDWVILHMEPPTEELGAEAQLVAGGYIQLGKEIASGILNPNKSLYADQYKFTLESVLFSDGKSGATVAVYDVLTNDLLTKVNVWQCEMADVLFNNKAYSLKLWKGAAAEVPEMAWADLSVMGESTGVSNGAFTEGGYTTLAAWKNRGASPTDKKPDHLRSIIFYASGNDISGISDIYYNYLKKGEHLWFAYDGGIDGPKKPWKLVFEGIDLKPEDYDTLKFTASGDAFTTLVGINGDPTAICTLNPPYVKITSSTANAFTFYTTGNEIYVPVSGVDENCPFQVSSDKFAIFIKDSATSTYTGIGVIDPDPTPGNGILGIGIVYSLASSGFGNEVYDGGTVMAGRKNAAPYNGYFSISESAATALCKGAVDSFVTYFNNPADISYQSFDATKDYFSTTHPNGGFMSAYTNQSVEPGFVTERGSIFKDASIYTVTFKTAKKLGKAKFTIKTSEGPIE